MLRSQFAPSRFWERPRAGRWVVLGVLLAALSLGSAHAGETHYLEARLEPSAGSFRADFGHNVAIDGATAVVAMTGYCYFGCDGGAFVFELADGSWEETAVLRVGTGKTVTGVNVALSGDSIAVVQEPEGQVYLYFYLQTDPGVWSQTDSASWLGGFLEVALDHDGSRVAAGDRVAAVVRVFEQDAQDPTRWTQILEVDELLLDFSETVAIDGGTLVAGTRGEAIAGIAYDEATTGWWSSDLPTCLECGFSVAIDSPHLVVGGVPGENRVEVFQRIDGSWFPDGTLTGGLEITRFGASVAISRNVIAVGDPEADGGAGRVTLYHEKEGEWLEAATILPPPDGNHFGNAVALSQDRLLVGAPRTGEFGAAFIYRLCRATTGILDTCDPPERGSSAIR